MTPEDVALQTRKDAGVLLPGIDPTIGEIVLSAFHANEHASAASIIAGLVVQAPETIKIEVMEACLEFLICKEKGKLYWVDVSGKSILLGIRERLMSHCISFGHADWPLEALMTASPLSCVIRMPDGARRVWLACEPLDGVVVRQSEAIALGNAMIESFGGRIIEDRSGPEVMQQSFIEDNMTKRAKLRAQANAAVERMIVVKRATGKRPNHNRIPMAESLPGACPDGMRLVPEGREEPVYEVEKRVNEDWVLLVAIEPEAAGNVAPCSWKQPGTMPGPWGLDGAPTYWGFTDTAGVWNDNGCVEQA